MRVTAIELHRGSGMWHGIAIEGDSNYLWYADRDRSRVRFQKQEPGIPNCWMNVDPPRGAEPVVLKAVRLARQS
jgi:hypothetical protein